MTRNKRTSPAEKEAVMAKLLEGRDDEELQDGIREHITALYPPLAHDNPDDDADMHELGRAYVAANAALMLLKKTDAGKALSHERRSLFDTAKAFPRCYAKKKNLPYKYVKFEIKSSLHDCFGELLVEAVRTQNRPLCAGVLSYDLGSRIGLIVPGKRSDGHVNIKSDVIFEDERATMMFPDKKKQTDEYEPYAKLHMLNAELAQEAWQILYSSDEPISFADVKNELRGIEGHFTMCSGHKFLLRYVRNLSLTMFQHVWDTSPVHENSLMATALQAHHKNAGVSMIYTNSNVNGAGLCKGRILDEQFRYEVFDSCCYE